MTKRTRNKKLMNKKQELINKKTNNNKLLDALGYGGVLLMAKKLDKNNVCKLEEAMGYKFKNEEIEEIKHPFRERNYIHIANAGKFIDTNTRCYSCKSRIHEPFSVSSVSSTSSVYHLPPILYYVYIYNVAYHYFDIYNIHACNYFPPTGDRLLKIRVDCNSIDKHKETITDLFSNTFPSFYPNYITFHTLHPTNAYLIAQYLLELIPPISEVTDLQIPIVQVPMVNHLNKTGGIHYDKIRKSYYFTDSYVDALSNSKIEMETSNILGRPDIIQFYSQKIEFFPLNRNIITKKTITKTIN